MLLALKASLRLDLIAKQTYIVHRDVLNDFKAASIAVTYCEIQINTLLVDHFIVLHSFSFDQILELSSIWPQIPWLQSYLPFFLEHNFPIIV